MSDKIESETDYDGVCKICKCETLGGHYINCFIYKKEQQIKALQDEVKRLTLELEDKTNRDEKGSYVASYAYHEIAEILNVPDGASVIEFVENMKDEIKALQDRVKKLEQQLENSVPREEIERLKSLAEDMAGYSSAKFMKRDTKVIYADEFIEAVEKLLQPKGESDEK